MRQHIKIKYDRANQVTDYNIIRRETDAICLSVEQCKNTDTQLILFIRIIVSSNRKYFVTRQNCKRTHCCNPTVMNENFHIADSYIYAKNHKKWNVFLGF